MQNFHCLPRKSNKTTTMKSKMTFGPTTCIIIYYYKYIYILNIINVLCLKRAYRKYQLVRYCKQSSLWRTKLCRHAPTFNIHIESIHIRHYRFTCKLIRTQYYALPTCYNMVRVDDMLRWNFYGIHRVLIIIPLNL